MDHYKRNGWQLSLSYAFIYEMCGQLLLQHYTRELKCNLLETAFENFVDVLAADHYKSSASDD